MIIEFTKIPNGLRWDDQDRLFTYSILLSSKLSDDKFVINPSKTQMETSQLDLVVAGSDSAVLMVESEAKELSEEIMLGAVKYGHDQMQTIIKAIDEFTAEVGVDKLEWNPVKRNNKK